MPQFQNLSKPLLQVRDSPTTLTVGYHSPSKTFAWKRETPSSVLGGELRGALKQIRLRTVCAHTGILTCPAETGEIVIENTSRKEIQVQFPIWLGCVPYDQRGTVILRDADGTELERHALASMRLTDALSKGSHENSSEESLSRSPSSSVCLRRADSTIVVGRDPDDGRVTLIERYPDVHTQSWLPPGERWAETGEPGRGRRTVFGEAPGGTAAATLAMDDGSRDVPVHLGFGAWVAILPADLGASVEFKDESDDLIGEERISPQPKV